MSERYRVAAGRIRQELPDLERVVGRAESVDESLPVGDEWHRDLLRQMEAAIPQVRPPVLSTETIKELDEYLGFRHVVRNIYAFEFGFERIERLVRLLRSLFDRARAELLAFADLLERLAGGERS